MKEVEVYKKLKKLRKERGLTLNNLAEKIGTDYQQISRIERGKSRLTVDVLLKMADALDTPITDIVKVVPDEIKREPIQNQQNAAAFLQEALASILEKIDVVFHEANTSIQPCTKAMLTSKIYTQTLMLFREKNDIVAMDAFIDYSIGLVKIMILD